MNIYEVREDLKTIKDYIEAHKLDPTPEAYEELEFRIQSLIEEIESEQF